jgi:hypothetical protein
VEPGSQLKMENMAKIKNRIKRLSIGKMIGLVFSLILVRLHYRRAGVTGESRIPENQKSLVSAWIP